MHKKRVRALGAVAAMVAAGVTAASTSGTAHAAPFGYKDLNQIQKRLVSGAMTWYFEHNSASATPNVKPGGSDDGGDGVDGLPDTPPSSFSYDGRSNGAADYQPTGTGACTNTYGSNVKVNQNCLNVSDPTLQGRGQANNETFIAVDRYHPQHLVASDNDYFRGDGNCGAAYSKDGGSSWNDAVVPMSFTAGNPAGPAPFAREYWQAGGDTSVGWDTRGNAYLSCQVFNRGGAPTSNSPDTSSAFLVFRSTQNDGASYNFPGRYSAVSFEPGASNVLLDKQLMAVDNYKQSPYRDRIYVTYTLFASDGTAYIYEVYSKDYGEHFSTPVVVSKNSGLCGNAYGLATPHGSCNENQYSDPFVGPDGALYVTWSNFNNAVRGDANRNQMLLAKSTDGGRTFGKPVLVGYYNDLPDCQTYQGDDAFRACVPEKGKSQKSVFRATNYASGAVNPTDPGEVTVTYGSYINRNSDASSGCKPEGFSKDTGLNLYQGVKKAGACNNDIVLSVSHNGGSSFTGTHSDVRTMATVTQTARQANTDQFFQWEGYTNDGKLVVSYMDRQYGNDEATGSSDVSLSSSSNLRTFVTQRVTTSSMPAPTEFYGVKGGLFYGDYQGLAVSSKAYPVWSDTRNKSVFLCPHSATGPGNPPKLCHGIEDNGQYANDEDMYTASVLVPARS